MPTVLDHLFIDTIGVFAGSDAADDVVRCFSTDRMSQTNARNVVAIVASFLEWRDRVRGERIRGPQFLGPSEDVMRELEQMTPAGAAERSAMGRAMLDPVPSGS